jgi:NAD(P)-dependent dehydrogenase (short-subunit alcohol dehydrogenase family)
MVTLDTVRSANAALAKCESLTAVFVGATTGIGEYSVRALTNSYGKGGKGLRIYIVGRNERAAEAIISELRQVSKSGDFRFVRANSVALLKDVDRISAEIIKLEEAASQTAKIDLLVMTQGTLTFSRKGREKTPFDFSSGYPSFS